MFKLILTTYTSSTPHIPQFLDIYQLSAVPIQYMSASSDLPKSGPTGVNHKHSRFAKIAQFLHDECTFFRIHLFAFIFVPLIFSGVFYASNGRFRVDFVDSLFLSYSAMTVTGLSTVDLSTITPWQQVILYLLMMIVSFEFSMCELGIWSDEVG